MELENGSGNIAFAEHQNQQMVAARSNYVLSGLVVTAAVGSNLTDGSDDIDVSTGYCFNNNTLRSFVSIGNLDLSTHYSGLSTGQSRFVFIYINTSGTLVSVAGTVATTGQQLPPNIVDNTVVLAMVTLTHLDTTVDSPDIEDWLIRNPIGSAMGDNEKSYWGDDGDLSVYHDNAHAYVVNTTGDIKFTTGKISLSSGTNINEFSIDGTLAGDSDDAVPTEKAVKTYVDALGIPSLAELTDVSMTGPQLEDITTFNASNKEWFSCANFGASNSGLVYTLVNGIVAGPSATGTGQAGFTISLPTTLGGLKLYITGIRIGVVAAATNDKISDLTMYGVATSGVGTFVKQDTTGKTVAGEYSFTFTAEDMSAHASAIIYIGMDTVTATNLTFRTPQIQYYYAA